MIHYLVLTPVAIAVFAFSGWAYWMTQRYVQEVDMDVCRNPNELAQCTGKAAFGTRRLATKVARRRSRRGVRGSPYLCQHCGEYHIGLMAKYNKRKFQ